MDANERNRQEERIREARDYVSLILDATPLACRLWSRDFKILECNNKAVEMYDLSSKQEFMDNYFKLHPEYQPNGVKSVDYMRQMIAKAFDEGGFTLQWMTQKLDGTPIPTEVTLVRVPYGDNHLVAGFSRDLSEYNSMMRGIAYRDTLLRASNTAAVKLLATFDNGQFEVSLVEGIRHIAEYLEVDRVYIWRNEMINGEMCYKAIFSWYNETGSEGNPVSQGVAMPLSSFSKEFNDTLARGVCIRGASSNLNPRDRSVLSALGVKSLLILPVFIQGSFWGAVTFDDCHSDRAFTDAEEDILHTAGLMMISAILQHDMTNSIIAANEAKSDFLAKMSHEMRTPLSAVLGLAELALSEGGLPKNATSSLEQIYGAGSTLLGIVNDILDISKIEAGKLELIMGEYDVPSLLNDSINQTIIRIGSKPIEFLLDVDENMYSRLYGDELRIKQILNNLLSNAFKYTVEGLVKLTVSCTRDDDVVWLTIKVFDTGIGISPENLKIVFTDFEQFDTGANRNIEGTGLGLPITKRLAELMDGTITAESEYGIGSVFTVRIAQKYVGDNVLGREMTQSLRAFRYSDGKRSSNARLNRISIPYARVLVVDDNATNLNVAMGFLKQYGMQVDCVSSGRKAIDAIREEKHIYSAVFMDHMMPGMDGIEATRIIRTEIGTPYAENIPIIALTANAISGNEEMFMSKGFQAFIAKPIDVHRLDEVVRRWVRDKSREKNGSQFNGFSAGNAGKAGADNNITGSGNNACTNTDNDNGTFNETDNNDNNNGNDNDNETDAYADISAGRGVVIDIAGISTTKLEDLFSGDIKLAIAALRSFGINTPDELRKLEHVTEDTLGDYVITVHGLKGSCASIGAVVLQARAQHLETSAGNGDISEVRLLNDDLIADTQRLINNINEQLDAIDAAAGRPARSATPPIKEPERPQ